MPRKNKLLINMNFLLPITNRPLAYNISVTSILQIDIYVKGIFLKTLSQEIDAINFTDSCLHVIARSSEIETVSCSSQFEARFTTRDAKHVSVNGTLTVSR